MRTILRVLFLAAHSPPAKIAAKAKGVAQNRGATRWACVVVVAVTITGTEIVLAEKMTEFGFRLQVTPTGAPEQEMDTDPTKLLLLPNARLKVAVCPAATVADVLPLAECKRCWSVHCDRTRN